MPHLPMISQRELARLSNVSARTLGRLGLPRTRSGDYALAPTLQYRLDASYWRKQFVASGRTENLKRVWKTAVTKY